MNAPLIYWPGASWLHRAPVWSKATVVFASAVALGVSRDARWSGAAIAVTVAVAISATVPARVLARAMLPFLVSAVVFGALQFVWGDRGQALSTMLRITAQTMVAVVAVLATRGTDVVDAVERGLLRLRVRPDRVFRMGLLVGVTLRSVEYLVVSLAQVGEARRARGLHRSVRALAVPGVVAAARFAHDAGEAMSARGIADPDLPQAAEQQPA